MIINDIEFKETSFACPEIWDAYKDGEYIGYVRLRHGIVRISLDDPDQTLYSEDISQHSDGVFYSDKIRTNWLTKAAIAFEEHFLREANELERFRDSIMWHDDF